MKPLCRAFALAALLLAAPLAIAQEQARASDADVDRLLEVMRAEEQTKLVVPQMLATMKQMVDRIADQEGVDQEERERMHASMEREHAAMASAMSWERLQPLYRDIYAKTFTNEEVEALIVFYNSPTGQSLLDKTPLLMQNTMGAIQELVVPMMQEMEQAMLEEAAAD